MSRPPISAALRSAGSHVAAISHERRTRSAPPRATAMLIAYGENPSSRNRAV
ncbi:MAG: hypothetical protein R2723_07355 [Microbacterium sp.]